MIYSDKEEIDQDPVDYGVWSEEERPEEFVKLEPNPHSSREYVNVPAPFKEFVDDPSPLEQYAVDPAHFDQYADNPSHNQQCVDDPSPLEQYADNPSHKQQCVDDPSPLEQYAVDPAHFNQYADNPSYKQQCVDDPTPLEQYAVDPAHLNQYADNPSHNQQCLDDPSPLEQYAVDPAHFNQYADNPSYKQQCVDDPSPLEQYAVDPAHLNQYADNPSHNQQCLDDPSPLEQYAVDPSHFNQHADNPSHYQHCVDDTSSYPQYVDDLAPFQQYVDDPASSLQYVADPAPIQQYVVNPSSCQQCVYDSAPFQQYVDDSTPLQQCVDDSIPLQQCVDDSIPLQQCVDDSTPLQQCVDDSIPLQQCVDDSIPLQQFVDDSIPLQQYVDDSTPLQQYVDDSTPLQQYVDDSTPLQHCVDDSAPLQLWRDEAPLQHIQRRVTDTEICGRCNKLTDNLRSLKKKVKRDKVLLENFRQQIGLLNDQHGIMLDVIKIFRSSLKKKARRGYFGDYCMDALKKIEETLTDSFNGFRSYGNPTMEDEETTEDAVSDEGDKREGVYRRTIETYPRTAPITANLTTTTTQHHYHRHHHHHHSNHGNVVATSPPPPPPPPVRTTPSSPAHAITPPSAVCVRPTSGPIGGVTTVQSQQQQTSPRTSLSYPGSPASSPPRVVLTPRGSSSPLGLLSAFSQDSSSPPMGASEQALNRLPHENHHHPHLNNGLRHNGLTKSLSVSPPSHNYSHHNMYSPEESFKDDKKRSGSTPSREVHNKLEKNRRAHLKECFETLRRQLPSMDDKKISNQTILKAAHRHIQTLKRKEREYEHEMERLAREKIAHQQKLSALKKELSARWDHIDFNTLLPDMSSLEQHRDKETKSTTTASEQPDLEEDSPMRVGGDNNVQMPLSAPAPCPVSPRMSSNHPQGTSFTTIATSSNNSIGATGMTTLREPFADSNQPLNLSTSMIDTAKVPSSGQTLVTHAVSQHQNGEWGTRQSSPHYTQAPYHTNVNIEEEVWPTSVVTTVGPTATSGDTITSVHSEHHLPIMGSAGGIHLPAQLVAGGMQLNGAPGGLLGQPAIQVITPEGYKLLPADHAPNGAKPLTITLAHPAEGLERAENAEDLKSGPGAMMVALNKNGVSALHLAVPTTPRSLPHSQGTNGTVTTVPLNLSVGGAATVKVTSAATSIIPSYIPITHANGITQLVSGLGSSVGTLVSGIGTPLVAPLVVSQPQRPVVPGSATIGGSKGLKAAAVAGSTNSMPLVPAQYASSLAGSALGGLVKPVVMVSAPAAVAGMVTGAPAGASGKP